MKTYASRPEFDPKLKRVTHAWMCESCEGECTLDYGAGHPHDPNHRVALGDCDDCGGLGWHLNEDHECADCDLLRAAHAIIGWDEISDEAKAAIAALVVRVMGESVAYREVSR